jgi:RNA polymerase sigma factor (sigma-70 family)
MTMSAGSELSATRASLTTRLPTRREHTEPLSPTAKDVTTSAPDERDQALAGLFDAHYASMVRLATLLGADDPEDIVAEAFYQLYRRWPKLRDPAAAEPYLRSVVCNLTRMRIRHLQVSRKHLQGVGQHLNRISELSASAENSALLQEDQRALIEALRSLAPRQREALVLRHWLGLREREIAEAMGISVGSVKTHTSRGVATLTRVMGMRK